jgi:hypothetical protein
MSEESKARAEELTRWVRENAGLPESFLTDLLDEDDWSFVIKAHALMEMVMNRTLSIVLGKPQLDEIISFLDTSEQRRGKVAFLRALEVFQSHDKNFVRWFSDLRNDIAHDVSNVSFTFEEWFKDESRKKAMRDVFNKIPPGETPPQYEGVQIGELALREPKLSILAQIATFITKARNREHVASLEKIQSHLGRLAVEEAERQLESHPESTATGSTPTHQSESPQG